MLAKLQDIVTALQDIVSETALVTTALTDLNTFLDAVL